MEGKRLLMETDGVTIWCADENCSCTDPTIPATMPTHEIRLYVSGHPPESGHAVAVGCPPCGWAGPLVRDDAAARAMYAAHTSASGPRTPDSASLGPIDDPLAAIRWRVDATLRASVSAGRIQDGPRLRRLLEVDIPALFAEIDELRIRNEALAAAVGSVHAQCISRDELLATRAERDHLLGEVARLGALNLDQYSDRVDTLTRQRDEARAELAELKASSERLIREAAVRAIVLDREGDDGG